MDSQDSNRTKSIFPTSFSVTELWSRLRAFVQSWRYPVGEKRDLRLDVMRGLAVFVMVVDHFGGSSWLYLLTGNNSFFTSGAESFVLISGMVVGIVYGGIALREGLKSAIVKALQRAFTLYKLTIVMTFAFALISDWFALPWSQGVDLGDPISFIVNVLFFRQTYYLADIPLLYTLLMAFAPIGLWLLVTRRTAVLLIGSFLLWAGFQFVNFEQIMIMPIVGNTTFHPAAWQLLFFGAMAFGFHRPEIIQRFQRVPRVPYFVASVLLFFWLLHLYSTEIRVLAQMYPGIDIATLVADLFSKSTVAPGRILATIVVFQFVYLVLTYFWRPLWAGLGWFFAPLGQNSLYSYTMHVVIIGLFYVVLPYLPGHITEQGTLNTALQLGVLFLLWILIRQHFAFEIVPR